MSPGERATSAAKRFPVRLKAARKRAGLTQDALVTAAEFAPVTLSKLETGVNLPTFDILVRLAYALDVSPNYLLGWEAIDPEGDKERQNLTYQLSLIASELPVEWLRELISVARLAGGARR